MSSYSNFERFEGNLTGDLTLTFNNRPRRIVLTNDSASNNMKFKFNDTENFGTLLPTETITLDLIVKNVYVQGTNIDYRIWGIG